MNKHTTFSLKVSETTDRCPIGEQIGTRNANEGAIPVLSCEGACIRGEIARLTANQIGKAPGFRRACHGELFTVPGSTMATWVNGAREIVVIDGCHLRCHARVVENLLPKARMHGFNAASHHRRFHDVFDIEDVPEAQRMTVAKGVATWVLKSLENPPNGGPGKTCCEQTVEGVRPAGPGCGCGG